jgi:4-amino-4-deoxy-L-arabinose transferase-like glycosyltransferase
VFAIYWFLRRLSSLGSVDAALMLACSAGIVGYARAASMDMALTATFVIAMLAWYAWSESGSHLHLAISYVSLALAMLAKGPVAPFLAVVIIGVFAAVQHDLKIALRTLWFPGILLFCFVSLPWYVVVQHRNTQFFRFFILEHNLARFGTNVFHHPEPFWYYAPVTLLAWVPWTVFVVAALVWAIRRFREQVADGLNSFLVIWIAVIVIFFSISQSKLPGYVLPAIPPGILLIANYMREKFGQRPHPAMIVLYAALSGSLIFAALLVRYALLQHRVQWDSFVIGPLVLAIAAGTLVAFLFMRSGFSGLRVATIVPVVALAIALRFGAPALDETLSARSVSEALARLAPQQLPVAVVLVPRETEFGLQFYRNQKIPRYELGQAPAGEHLVVAVQGFRNAFAKNVPGRRIVYLGNFPAQKLEFFYVGQ